MTIAAALLLALVGTHDARDETPAPHDETLRAEADALATLVDTELGAAFLAAARELPRLAEPRVLWVNRATGDVLRAEEARARGAEELAGFEQQVFDADAFYRTFYGSPLAYARAVDLAGAHGVTSLDGARVLDFGFGGIGHLRALAACGAQAVGVEVSATLRALYGEPGDTGPVPRCTAAGEGEPGGVRLFFGSFPGDAELAREVGEGYRLVLSKNVLKRGYVHPERETDPRWLVHLGVSDGEFLAAVHRALAPGGLLVVYNVYGKQNPPDRPYLPAATGGCPFAREACTAAGFEVLEYDRDDTPVVRELGARLGWEQGMSLDELFAMVTILRRPG